MIDAKCIAGVSGLQEYLLNEVLLLPAGSTMHVGLHNDGGRSYSGAGFLFKNECLSPGLLLPVVLQARLQNVSLHVTSSHCFGVELRERLITLHAFEGDFSMTTFSTGVNSESWLGTIVVVGISGKGYPMLFGQLALRPWLRAVVEPAHATWEDASKSIPASDFYEVKTLGRPQLINKFLPRRDALDADALLDLRTLVPEDQDFVDRRTQGDTGQYLLATVHRGQAPHTGDDYKAGLVAQPGMSQLTDAVTCLIAGDLSLPPGGRDLSFKDEEVAAAVSAVKKKFPGEPQPPTAKGPVFYTELLMEALDMGVASSQRTLLWPLLVNADQAAYEAMKGALRSELCSGRK
jgi:hypothetical protein